MADRTSAYLFGEIFGFLAKDPTEANKKAARHFWKLAADYDFTEDQMDCDKALIKLELCRKRPKEDHVEYGWYQYRSRDGKGWQE